MVAIRRPKVKPYRRRTPAKAYRLTEDLAGATNAVGRYSVGQPARSRKAQAGVPRVRRMGPCVPDGTGLTLGDVHLNRAFL